MRLPTCDDTDRPALKAVVHGLTALTHIVILAYRVASMVRHAKDARAPGSS